MLVKLHLDPNCFPILKSTIKAPTNSTTTTSVSTNTGTSVSPLETVEPLNKHNDKNSKHGRAIESPKRFTRVHKQSYDKRISRGGGVVVPNSKNHFLNKSPDGKRRGTNGKDVVVAKMSGLGATLMVMTGNGVVDKANTKCSTKWSCYGGCIPSILQALETIRDLDEAFRPWEDTLNNKERSIILKEQRSWERALEIFEWFKRGCYELNVIHYNIILRILGKARKWSHVECLWNEMNGKGILPINSTYATLIDVYSKGGLKNEALFWLEKMDAQGMEPDEVTTAIVVQLHKKAREFQKAEEFFKKWSKWSCYGGCIPSILQALETIRDLDKAFRRWEDTLNNKERSIILKEQRSWERALEIFEWFKRKGCYELNVIHYNIILRILGKARKWSHVECLWNEMNGKGILPINSTYGTLIDVYSKGGLKNEALFWLEKMNARGMEPDEATMAIVVQLHKKAGEFQKAEEFFKKWSIGECLKHEDAKVARSGMRDDRLCLSPNTYNILIDTYGKAGQLKEASETFAQMLREGIMPTTVTFNTMIHMCGNHGKLEEVGSLMQKMEELRCPPDEVTMAIVVQLHKKAREFQKAEEFIKKWSIGKSLKHEDAKVARSGMRDDRLRLIPYTYNKLIDTYGKAGQLKEASETFAQMLREGIMPTTVTFNTMIHMCGNHGKLEEVGSLMRKMEELRCPPDTRTYNILISLHARRDNINMATSYFKGMKQAQLVPDLVSYRTLLYAYSIRHMVKHAEDLVSEMDEKGLEIDEYTQSALTRMYIEAGLLEKSWMWFRRFHLSGNMTSECYSANIDAYGERGCITEAENVFKCCQEGKKLSFLEFNVMIKSYGLAQNYDKACELFDSMESHGVAATKCSYSSIIQILASAGLPDRARHYLKSMEEAELVSDCIPHCTVISSFVKLGHLEMAEILYKEMIALDVKPDVTVYLVLINAFADAGSVEKALSYANTMKRQGLNGNTAIYNSLMKLFTKVGYLKEAEETYRLLQSSSEGPDAYSSNCMMDLYSERSMVKQAEELFENLKRKRMAHELTYAMMLCMYKRLGWFEEAFQIAKQMRELGLLTRLLSYNNVLGLYAKDGRFKEAVATFKEMLEACVQPDEFTFKSLGIVLVKCGLSKQAIGKLEAAEKEDTQSGLQAWMTALSNVVEVNDDDNDDL